jgi:hypothetical protein
MIRLRGGRRIRERYEMTEGPELSREHTTDEPGELFEFPGARERTKPENNLPLQLSSLIGRDKESRCREAPGTTSLADAHRTGRLG